MHHRSCVVVTVLIAASTAFAVPPPNDQCSGAEVIPGAGPFPYLTAVTTDITDATATGDPAPPSCGGTVSRSIWYAFQPAVSGNYVFSSCADAPTGSTVDDTVVDVLSSTGTCGAFTPVSNACDDNTCMSEPSQAVSTAALIAGTQYYVIVYKRGATAPSAGNTAVQLRVTANLPPANDLCTAAIPVTLNVPVQGTTVFAADDYRSPTSGACWAGLGQQSTDSRGLDVAYSFTAPTAGDYAFRVSDFQSAGGDLTVYVASDCPTGVSPQTPTCILGANRTTNEGVEEASCVTLTASQSVYVYVDGRSTGGNGSPFRLEVERCPRETESNDTPATASALACGVRGTIDGTRLDFFSVPAGGGRLFAIVDGSALGNANPDLRVTNATDTLEYDDADNDTEYGNASPNVSGTPVPVGPLFLKVDDIAISEPYRIYAVVQPPESFAAAESEPNDTVATANTAAQNYFTGTLPVPAPSTDVDVFALTAAAGDLILLGLDADPTRDQTPINAVLELLDPSGTPLRTVDDPNQSSDNNASPNNLDGQRPRFPSESLAYRVSQAGTYYARVSIRPGVPVLVGAGDYLLSISRNCETASVADLSITNADAPDPIASGDTITYTIVVGNAGPGSAVSTLMEDTLPAGTTFVSLTPAAGWTCSTPSIGGTGTVSCSIGGAAAGNHMFQLVVATDPCGLGSVVVSNTATVTSPTTDPDYGDRSASTSTTVTAALDTDNDGTPNACDTDDDNDGVPDVSDCAPLDNTASVIPGEVFSLAFSDKDTLGWVASVSSARYEIARGPTNGFPVGSSGSEACVTPPGGTFDLTFDDATLPSAGAGFWYLVRARNACGAGTYGTRSNGVPRVTAACP